MKYTQSQDINFESISAFFLRGREMLVLHHTQRFRGRQGRLGSPSPRTTWTDSLRHRFALDPKAETAAPAALPAPPLLCTGSSVPCREGKKCVSPESLCDGEQDCLDGSDEENCFQTCHRPGLSSSLSSVFCASYTTKLREYSMTSDSVSLILIIPAFPRQVR